MVNFVCNSAARAAHAATLSTLEQRWSTFEAKMPHGGCSKLAIGRWTDILWTKTDTKNFQAAMHEPRMNISFNSARHKQEDWNRLKVCS